MNQEIISLIRQNTKDITDLVGTLSEDKTHTSPAEGKWSIIQICDHLMSVDYGVYSLLSSDGKTPEKDRSSLIPKLETRAVDRTTKATAPPHLVPKGKTDTIEKFVTKYPSLREKMINAIEGKDLHLVCDVFPHFVFGYMTFEEWLRFVVLHTKRHMLQIEEVLQELS